MIEYPVPPGVSSSPLPFSPATKVGNLIFVSGQASTNEKGEIVSDTFESEFRRSMENVRRILRGQEVRVPWERWQAALGGEVRALVRADRLDTAREHLLEQLRA